MARRILSAFIFLSATIAIILDYQDSSWFLLFKPLTTILVILIPVLERTANKVFRKWLIIALSFCLLGDTLLLNPDYFVYGLCAFLIAHLAFVKGFVGIQGFQKNAMVCLALLIVGFGEYFWLFPDLGTLKFPVAAYVLVILLMVWQGVGLYLQEKRRAYFLIAMGALLFMFSDSMIAVSKFKLSFDLSGVVILSTYWLGITLIANASHLISES